jgi:predicted DNA-binding transcriptional regulator YafY
MMTARYQSHVTPELVEFLRSHFVLEMKGDGWLVLRVPYRHATELQMDILRHGAGVEVLAPESLRRQVAVAHEEAARRYRTATTPAATIEPQA